MATLLISLLTCVVLLAIIFIIIWQRTDWKKFGRANREFLDANTDPIDYNRRKIEFRKKQNNSK